MGVNKAKLTAGFIVAGVLMVFFGTVLVFVGPIVIDDQVEKVSGTSEPTFCRCRGVHGAVRVKGLRTGVHLQAADGTTEVKLHLMNKTVC